MHSCYFLFCIGLPVTRACNQLFFAASRLYTARDLQIECRQAPSTTSCFAHFQAISRRNKTTRKRQKDEGRKKKKRISLLRKRCQAQEQREEDVGRACEVPEIEFAGVLHMLAYRFTATTIRRGQRSFTQELFIRRYIRPSPREQTKEQKRSGWNIPAFTNARDSPRGIYGFFFLSVVSLHLSTRFSCRSNFTGEFPSRFHRITEAQNRRIARAKKKRKKKKENDFSENAAAAGQVNCVAMRLRKLFFPGAFVCCWLSFTVSKTE